MALNRDATREVAMAVQEAQPHPVIDALGSALKVREERLKELLGGLPSQDEWGVLGRVLGTLLTKSVLADGELETAVRDFRWLCSLQQLLQEISELESWLHPPLSPAERNRRADQLAKLVLSEGVGFSDAAESAAPARKRPPGAPVKRRFIAAQALELKKLKRTRSWTKIAIQCCNCGNSRHTDKCAQVIRQEVMALERVLRKYGIHPWEEPT
jgi:hypothetical protein